MSKQKVLIVGQTPPPFYGQSIMIETLLGMDRPDVELIHIRMEFSRDMNEVARFKYRKVMKLASLIARIIWARLTKGPTVLCYPPAGPPVKIPLYRDLIVLMCTRWMFRRTVWYFHACGLTDWYKEFPVPLKLLCRLAYFRPDACIQLSDFTPSDGKALLSRRTYSIPYGIEDARIRIGETKPPSGGPVKILFVGRMCELKGMLVLLEAGGLLRRRGVDFRMQFMGSYESPEFPGMVEEVIQRGGIRDNVEILGVKTGDEKFRVYAQADIFSLPTHHDSESFGLVAVEAMCFGLPVVVTRWRGLQSIVEEGKTGFLVPIRAPEALADKLELLIKDPELRRKMGEKGREGFLEKFTIRKYHENVARVFLETEMA